MARAEIPFVVQDPLTGEAIPSATITIKYRGTATNAPVYAAESGSSQYTQPLTSTNPEGRIDGWLEEDSYDMTVSGSGIATFTQPIEIVRGDTVKVFAGARLADRSVTKNKIALGTLTYEEVAAGTITHANLDPSVLPIGSVISWWRPNSSIPLPAGWVPIDGRTLSSGQHSFGTGTSITLPDLRNKFILGANAGATDATAGSTSTAPGIRGAGGSHTRNFAHTHGMSHQHNHNHSHGVQVNNHVHGLAGHTHFYDHYHIVAINTSAPYNGIGTRTAGSLSTVTEGHQHNVSGYTYAGAYVNGPGGPTPSTQTGGPSVGDTNGAAPGGATNSISDQWVGTPVVTGDGGTPKLNTDGAAWSSDPGSDIRPAWVGLLQIMKVQYTGPSGAPWGGGVEPNYAPRSIATLTTASIASGAHDAGASLFLPAKGALVLQIDTNKPARVRLYATDAQRQADLARLVSVDPVGDHGLLVELVTTNDDMSYTLAPAPDCHNNDTPEVAKIYATITNLDPSAGSVTATFEYTRTE